jgi:rhodanese-related sulfurtransferase
MMLKSGDDVIVVDGRSEEAYQREHIPGAINIPHKGICADNTTALDKSKLYICYCDGIGCNASTKTAMKLLILGVQVKELLGGLDWWKRDGYSTMGQEGREGTPVACGC